MLIALEGGNFFNKGDELMLRSVVAVLSTAKPSVRFATRDLSPANRERFAELGVHYRVLWGPSLFRLQGTLGYLILRRYRRLFGIVTENEIDAVVDFGGFRFSDHWGRSGCLEYAQRLEKAKARGARIVLLPQAFGPCESTEVRSAIRRVFAVADLVFVRDRHSASYLEGLVPTHENVQMAPDFTNLARGELPSDVQIGPRSACVVPNYLITEKGSAVQHSEYIAFLVSCIREVVKYDLEPIILLHTAFEQDRQIAEMVQASYGRPLRIVADENPIHLKGIIGRCSIVIGSRYHALVHALTQGVPALGTAWSHKYNALFEEFGLGSHVVSPRDPVHEIAEKLSFLIEEPSHTRIKERLTALATERLLRTVEMWRSVGETLRLDLPGVTTEFI